MRIRLQLLAILWSGLSSGLSSGAAVAAPLGAEAREPTTWTAERAPAVERFEPRAVPSPTEVPNRFPSWRALTAVGGYAALYAGATKVGSRFGLESRFEIVRLESAYAYDLVGHVWAVREIGRLFGSLNRWAGMEEHRARRVGAWGAGFGSLTYMEIVNGFMPNVRFDPLDPVANALGAALAAEGPDLARRHRWLRRLSLEFGYKDWGRVFGPERSSGVAGNLWHDYPNGRFGLGVGLGPGEGRWARLFLSYEITSFEWEDLHNRFGLGLELKPHEWVAGWLEDLPGGRSVLGFVRWWDDRLLLPGLYVQWFTHDFAPFSRRDPFDEG